MPNLRLILIIGIVVAILAYISLIVRNGGLRIENFTGGIMDVGEKTNVFTMYYMNGCPHCETILPDFKSLVARGQIRNGDKVTQIRMLEQADPAAADEMEKRKVKGFPTFIFEKKDYSLIEYQGDRSIEAMKEFIAKNAS